MGRNNLHYRDNGDLLGKNLRMFVVKGQGLGNT